MRKTVSFIAVSLLVLLLSMGALANQITLEVWQIADMPESVYEDFERANPDIKLQVERMALNDARTVVPVALAGGTGPDVFSYTPGPGFGGALARAGLLLPLDEFFTSFGWEDRFFEWTYERETYDGVRYGIGDEPEILGVFYNKAIFRQLGLEVPETFDEFVAAAEALKGNGYIPIAFANQAGWPAYHVFSMFANNIAGIEKLDDVLFGDGRWDEPEFIEAVRTPFKEFTEAGYFTPGAVGVSYDDGNMLFYSGRAGMHMTGMWLLNAIIENTPNPDDIGFFMFPAMEEGGVALPPAGIGTSYYVSAHTEHPEAAARFLDFIFSSEVGKQRLEEYFMLPPFYVDTDDLEMPELAKMMIDTVQNASMDSEGVTMGYNIDVLTPTAFNQVKSDGFQAIMTGERTAEQVINEMQRVWEEEKSK